MPAAGNRNGTDVNGSQVRNLLIVPYKEKYLPLLGYFPGIVKTEKEEATELPILWNPDQLPILFSSSEPTVATVDANTGVVTIVGVGTTTITATFAGDEEYLPLEASYILTVTSGDTTAIEDVRMEVEKAQKLLHNGTLYILRPDGKVYTLQGQEVK
ncbi:MAG: Ig-like domain-containing protein [Paludibacteraceae bacterium]|nr:Ig-like domain-containing protein [Paludibacteraceae bacterium]MBQ6985285.1 Ig-like domain-containing protein [Paludibacteraceae bacterium]